MLLQIIKARVGDILTQRGGSLPIKVEEIEEPLLNIIETHLSADAQVLVYFNGGYVKEDVTYEGLPCVELYTGFTRILFVPYAGHLFVFEYSNPKWYPDIDILGSNLTEFTGGLRQRMEEHLDTKLKVARLEQEELRNRNVRSSGADISFRFYPIGKLIACSKKEDLTDLLDVISRCLVKGYEEETLA
jgi:hypothetical protein